MTVPYIHVVVKRLQIKYYLEGNGTDSGEVGMLLQKVSTELRDDWMEATKNGLEMPDEHGQDK